MKSVQTFLLLLATFVLVGCGNTSIYRPAVEKVCAPVTETGSTSGGNGRSNIRNTVRETCTWVEPSRNATCRETIVTNNSFGSNRSNFTRVTNQTCTWQEPDGRTCRESRRITFNSRGGNFSASPQRNTSFSCS
jgi:hypothetical protein